MGVQGPVLWCIPQPRFHLLRCVPVVLSIPLPAPRTPSSFLASRFGRRLMSPGSSTKPPDFSVDYDPFEDFFGLGIDMKTRKQGEGIEDDAQSAYEEHKKHGPCPVCRGRGYVPDGPKGDPSTCSCCGGEGMVLEDSIWESAWETAPSRSPLRVDDDEALDKVDPDVLNKPKKRVYGPRPEAVRKRISRTLKELERRTGALSKRAKRQHQNPVIHSRMVAAIKRSKNTDAAKLKVSENQKRFFQNPDNRRMRGLQMKGVKFSCKQCGKEGHRRHHCPELGFVRKGPSTRAERVYRCGVCGASGHTRRQCPQPQPSAGEERVRTRDASQPRGYKARPKGLKRGAYKCGHCHEQGHSRRTCPQLLE